MSGVVDALVGGPPCRTVSRARFRQPGPPPLRARYGPERFGLSGLTHDQRELAIGDGVLWLRQLWLYTLAQDARPKKVGFLKENPRDPEEYKREGDNNQYPSYFAWPEFGIEEIGWTLALWDTVEGSQPRWVLISDFSEILMDFGEMDSETRLGKILRGKNATRHPERGRHGL